jgi:hypothetical protein
MPPGDASGKRWNRIPQHAMPGGVPSLPAHVGTPGGVRSPPDFLAAPSPFARTAPAPPHSVAEGVVDTTSLSQIAQQVGNHGINVW